MMCSGGRFDQILLVSLLFFRLLAQGQGGAVKEDKWSRAHDFFINDAVVDQIDICPKSTYRPKLLAQYNNVLRLYQR